MRKISSLLLLAVFLGAVFASCKAPQPCPAYGKVSSVNHHKSI